MTAVLDKDSLILQIDNLLDECKSQLKEINDIKKLADLHTKTLGRKSKLINILKDIQYIQDKGDKKIVGEKGNQAKNKLIEEFSEDDYKEIKEKYEYIEKEISKRTSNDVYSYISSVSIVVLADYISSKYFFAKDNRILGDYPSFSGHRFIFSLSSRS